MKKDILIAFSVFLLGALLLLGTEFQTVDEYYLTHIDDIKPDSKTVTVSIDCGNIYDNYDKLDEALKASDYIPDDGVILPKTTYVLRDGDTVFDILYRAVRYNKIQFEYQGARDNPFGSAYIQGISYLYEFSCGSTSGWVYKVNGEFPNYGCSKYELCDGDTVEWIYTCNLGQDAGYDCVMNNTAGESVTNE